MEYLPLAKALAFGRPYVFGTILLASVYQTMSKYIYDEPYHCIGGALWFVQMWLLAYFPKVSNQDLTSFKTLGFHVVHSLLTVPSDDLMSFFLGLTDRALLHMFLKPNFVPLLAWNHTLASPRPYLHDFESSIPFTSTTCRVLISRGCFSFLASLSVYSTGLQPYLPCL